MGTKKTKHTTSKKNFWPVFNLSKIIKIIGAIISVMITTFTAKKIIMAISRLKNQNPYNRPSIEEDFTVQKIACLKDELNIMFAQ